MIKRKEITSKEFNEIANSLSKDDYEWIEDTDNFSSWFEMRDIETGLTEISGTKSGKYYQYIY